MTVLDPRDAEIVRLNRVDGESVRKIGARLNIHASTVWRVVCAFRQELAVYIGDLDQHTPDTLRSITITILDRAANVRAKAMPPLAKAA